MMAPVASSFINSGWIITGPASVVPRRLKSTWCCLLSLSSTMMVFLLRKARWTIIWYSSGKPT